MPQININGCSYFYVIHEATNPLGTILFSHALLWSGKIFEKQVAHFKNRYRIVIYDHRGQGQSEVTNGGYDMDQLYLDTVAIIEQLQLGKVHFVGLSMGTFTGLRIAARRPDLIKSLILMGASSQAEPRTLKYKLLIAIVKLFGVKSVAWYVMRMMFSKKFLNNPAHLVEKNRLLKDLQSVSKDVIPAVKGVINRSGIEAELKQIGCPTLIISGTKDKLTAPVKAEYIHQNILQSELNYINDAGHISCIEKPEEINKLIDEFVSKL